ncbi:MAG: glycosyltransferase [Bacteroidales bacterium]|jgi:glycosyltransferase involved in cell wall biosynthesis|nr:glycosyltransferase family 4 protein [Bacteroidales bacterium]NPV36732.1 glycosyltransferase [Bacteroidales bacterium]
MHPLRILFISRWYPNKEDPMPGLFVQRHAQAVALEAEVSVLYVHALSRSAQNIKPGVYCEKKNGVTELAVYYRSLSLQLPGVEIIKGLLYLHYMWKGYRILKKEKGFFQLIHVNILTRAAILPFLLNLFQGIPYIVTEHWSRYLPTVKTYQGFIRKWITRLIARRASALTAVTHNLKAAMQSHGIDNDIFEVIPNVVDTDFFTPAPEMPGEKILLHVSCFEDRSKNISGLLKAIALLKEKRKDFKVLLVGEGQDLALMMQLSNHMNLMDTVVFTGLAEGEQLLKYYRQSCCLVMFSNYENMPVVINESISCGKPVITTSVGGIPEIMNEPPEKGILIAPGEIEGLAEAMNKMLDGFQQFEPALLHRYAVEKFSKKAVGDAFLNLYKSCLNLQ